MSLYKDKYISFVINNYQDIKALFEIYDHAKTNIPSLIDREMNSYIEEIKFEFENVYCDGDGEGHLWWCDPEIYDLEQEKGPFISYKPRWSSLFSGNDPEDASFLYVYVDVGNLKQKSKKKEYIDKWIDVFRKESKKLKKQQCNIVYPVDYDDPYLVKYPLHREVNMATLADREKLKESVQKTIRTFTENYLSIIKDFK